MEPWFTVPALALFTVVVLAVVVGLGFIFYSILYGD